MDTKRKWRAAAVLTVVLFERKSGEKDAYVKQDKEELVVLSCGGTSMYMKASAQKIVFQTAYEDKEMNENVDAWALKKKRKKMLTTHLFVVV